MGGLRTKGILDVMTQKQRNLVLDAYHQEWPHFRAAGHSPSTVKSLLKDGIIEEVGKGFYTLTKSARNAIRLHLKTMGEG